MGADHSTGTERDAAISAGFDAYPDDRPSRADLAEEAAWWDWWWTEGRHQEASGPLIDALDRAVADRDPGTDWGEEAHQRVMTRLREEGAL